MESLSIWLKFARAIEHLEAVKATIAQDISTYGDLDQFIVEAQGKETLELLEPGPLISRCVGEFVYQLRSTLDHLAFDLVKINRRGIALPSKWDENCGFPIWTNLPKGHTAPLPYGAFGNLPGIPIEAHTLIEKVQPYYPAGTGSVNTSLKFLNALSNIDKHRRFTLTRVRAKVRHRVLYKSGFRGESLDTVDHGAEIPTPFAGENDPVVDVERSMSLTVAFDEGDALGDASGVPIDDLLENISTDVWGRVIDPLRRFMG